MTIKTTFAALLLMLSPSLSLAQGCSHPDAIKDASISCATGSSFDEKTGTCVPGTNS